MRKGLAKGICFACLLVVGHCRRVKSSRMIENTEDSESMQNHTESMQKEVSDLPQVVSPLILGCTTSVLKHALAVVQSQASYKKLSTVAKDTQQRISDMTRQVMNYVDNHESRFDNVDILALRRHVNVIQRISDCIGSSEAELHSKQVLHYLVPHIWGFLQTPIFTSWMSDQEATTMEGEDAATKDLGQASELCRLRYMQEQVEAYVSNTSNTDKEAGEDNPLLGEDWQEGVGAICAWLRAEVEAWRPGKGGSSGMLDLAIFGASLNSSMRGVGRAGQRVLVNGIKTSWLDVSQEILQEAATSAAQNTSKLAFLPSWLSWALTEAATSAGIRSLGKELTSMGTRGAVMIGARGLGLAFVGGMAGEACQHISGQLFPKSTDLSDEQRKVVKRAKDEDAKCSGFVRCSGVGGDCDCGAGSIVRFGVNGDPFIGNHWLQRVVSTEEAGSVHCSPENFGAKEHAYTLPKERGFGCECLRRELVGTESADSSEVGWEWCGTANKMTIRVKWCICKPRDDHTPAHIRFGRNGRWVSKPAPSDGYFECNAENFADVEGNLVNAVAGWQNYCMCNGVRELGDYANIAAFVD